MPSAREIAVRQNIVERAKAGELEHGDIKAAAAAAGVTRVTIYRDIQAGEVRLGLRAFELTDLDKLLIAVHGSVMGAYEDRVNSGRDPGVSYETYLRAFQRLPEAVRVGLRDGTQAAKRYLPYAVVERPYPGLVLELDAVVWDTWVEAPRRSDQTKKSLCRPHTLVLYDPGCGLVRMHTIYPNASSGEFSEDDPEVFFDPKAKVRHIGRAEPTAEVACAFVTTAFRPRDIEPGDLPYRGVELPWEWRGLPLEDFTLWDVRYRTLVVDNASAFRSNRMKQMAGDLGLELRVAPPYTGEHKPHVENFFGLAKRDDLYRLAGQIHGPETYSGKHPFRADGEDGDDGDWLTHEQFDEFIARLEFDLNVLRPRECFDDRTPLEMWVRNRPPSNPVPDGLLAPYRMRYQDRQRSKGADRRTARAQGIELDGEYYQAEDNEALVPWIGRRKEMRIRVEPGNRDWVDVWAIDRDAPDDPDADTYIGRAVHNADRDIQDKKDGAALRWGYFREIDNIIKAAGELSSRLALNTTDGALPKTTPHAEKVLGLSPDPVEALRGALAQMPSDPTMCDLRQVNEAAEYLLELAKAVCDDESADEDETPDPDPTGSGEQPDASAAESSASGNGRSDRTGSSGNGRRSRRRTALPSSPEEALRNLSEGERI